MAVTQARWEKESCGILPMVCAGAPSLSSTHSFSSFFPTMRRKYTICKVNAILQKIFKTWKIFNFQRNWLTFHSIFSTYDLGELLLLICPYLRNWRNWRCKPVTSFVLCCQGRDVDFRGCALKPSQIFGLLKMYTRLQRMSVALASSRQLKF